MQEKRHNIMTASKARSALIDKQIKALNGVKAKKVEAGWFESDRYGATKNNPVGNPVAVIARINEFGATVTRKTKDGSVTTVIPPRPFMRAAWLKFSSDRKKIQAMIAKKIIEGKMTDQQALGAVGNILEGYIAGSIRDGGWQGNAESTIAKKGFDKPLIDTGHMWKTVNSKVS